ncbi:MAG: zinc ABC transporter substrate-binding protein [Parachlamydiaceae bacterium]|nr:zinc ABC transporter substrate-binding protein [Parachlamydiaceae bacterium]
MNLLRLFLLLLVCTSCGSPSPDTQQRQQALKQWHEQNGKPKVLSTIAMINDLVKQIGAEHIDTLTLIQHELDPHSYQLVKGDDEKLASATLIFYNGLGLEHSPSIHHSLQTHANAVSLGQYINQHHPELLLYYQNQVDPHIWMDISLWTKSVPAIVEALKFQDPNHADIYEKNGQLLIESLNQAHAEVHDQVQQIPDLKRYLITSHDAFNYFTRAYLATDAERQSNQWQQRVAAPEGLSPESQLNPHEIQLIIDHMAKYNIHVIFPESNVSKDSIRKVVSAGKENGLNLIIADAILYADAMGKPGSNGDTYPKMIKHDATALHTWLTHPGNGSP